MTRTRPRGRGRRHRRRPGTLLLSPLYGHESNSSAFCVLNPQQRANSTKGQPRREKDDGRRRKTRHALSASARWMLSATRSCACFFRAASSSSRFRSASAAACSGSDITVATVSRFPLRCAARASAEMKKDGKVKVNALSHEDRSVDGRWRFFFRFGFGFSRLLL